MFSYNRVTSFRTNPNHVTMLEQLEPLRDEDISFYGLLAFSLQHRVVDLDRLPGNKSFEFSHHDRGLLTVALRQAGIRLIRSALEVCTIADTSASDASVASTQLIESNLYVLEGRNAHGLEIVERSVGVCSINTRPLD